MQLLTDVYSNFPHDKKLGMVPGNDVGAPPSVIALRVAWPQLLQALVNHVTTNPSRYRIEGSPGQRNLNYAAVPYVSTLDSRITTSTRRGYYVVLLFKADMSGAYLALAQGFGQYSDQFGSPKLALTKIRESTSRIKNLLAPPAGFTAIPIDLKSNNDLALGYMEGTIFSKEYTSANPPTQASFASDYLKILTEYESWFSRFGNDLPALTTVRTEEEFQHAAALAANATMPPPLPGKEAVPTRKMRGGGKSGFPRDPLRAGQAIRRAGFLCEMNPSHTTFQHASSKQNFVEAHHLVPMLYQDRAAVRLDVEENIVALCPNCHRHIHHGHGQPRRQLIDLLFKRRQASLASKGIEISLVELRRLYKDLELED